MVACPCGRTITAPAAPERLTKNVSFGSPVVSPFTTTAIVFAVWPAANVRLPATAL